jgi:hypothetical protein
MLGTAEDKAGVLQRAPDRCIGDSQPCLFGQLIRQTVQGPQGAR